MSYGWNGSIQEFLHTEQSTFLHTLQQAVPDASESQIRAWIDTYQKLQLTFRQFPTLDAYLVFEYSLLRGGGRRPDVILLINDQLLVIECKSYNQVSTAECIQTSFYVRDLEQYHSAVQQSGVSVSGILFLTSETSPRVTFDPVHHIYLTSSQGLTRILKKTISKSCEPALRLTPFLSGTYQPSPSVLEAARSIMENEDLPRVRALQSSNFEQVHQTIRTIVEQAKANKEHHLVLVTGEPGAGKTYLGLLIAHEYEHAVYLSGNGPLVNVLQETLQNETFVKRLYNYKMEYLRYSRAPHEQIILFDEAQRAWDAKKVDASLNRTSIGTRQLSEPDIIMTIATMNKPWSVTIGLVGEGQEIYSGEEGGLSLWNEALKAKQVIVHYKDEISLFTHAAQVKTSEALHLNTSLRAHTAQHYSHFVSSLLAGDFKTASAIGSEFDTSRFHLRITRNLQKAKAVAHQLYPDDTKTVGVVCAGGADHQKDIPVLPRENRHERPSKVFQFYNVRASPFYCKTLNYSITEFQSQGLELDFAILHWDDDFYLKEGQWVGQHFQKYVEDPLQLKRNAYRVNLTRGRDGVIIYIPEKESLNETWHTFKELLNIPEV